MESDPRQTTTYADALAALAVDGAGSPDVVLARYRDGWRMFATFSLLGPKVRTTSYTIDPVEALNRMEAETND